MKSPLGNWSNIKAFLTVVRTGSTLAASRELGVTQPTIARRIDEFEQELGLTLFDRDTRGFHLTPQARKLVAEAEKVEVAVRSFGVSASELSYDPTLPIRFSVPIAALSDMTYKIIAEFRDALPPLGLHIVMGSNARTKVSNMHANVENGVISPVQILARRI